MFVVQDPLTDYYLNEATGEFVPDLAQASVYPGWLAIIRGDEYLGPECFELIEVEHDD